MSKNNKYSLSVRLNAKDGDKIKKLAEQQQCSTAAIARQAITLYLKSKLTPEQEIEIAERYPKIKKRIENE